jgi:hypothetical protein
MNPKSSLRNQENDLLSFARKSLKCFERKDKNSIEFNLIRSICYKIEDRIGLLTFETRNSSVTLLLAEKKRINEKIN